MRRLIQAATGPAGAVVVTGSAGCGKSAALARLVTLADPAFCDQHRDRVAAIPAELRPPIGAVDVAVLATGKLPHEALAQICAALGVPIPASGAAGVPSLAELRRAWGTWLEARTDPVTIVIDALDEAPHPAGLLTDILAELQPPAPAPATPPADRRRPLPRRPRSVPPRPGSPATSPDSQPPAPSPAGTCHHPPTSAGTWPNTPTPVAS
jgi:hypothetical protein